LISDNNLTSNRINLLADTKKPLNRFSKIADTYSAGNNRGSYERTEAKNDQDRKTAVCLDLSMRVKEKFWRVFYFWGKPDSFLVQYRRFDNACSYPGTFLSDLRFLGLSGLIFLISLAKSRSNILDALVLKCRRSFVFPLDSLKDLFAVYGDASGGLDAEFDVTAV
jgi:hypothetical protein